MSSPTPRHVLSAATASLVALLVAVALPATADATRYVSGASAYGSHLRGTSVRSDKTSYLPMCTTSSSYAKSRRSARSELGPFGTVGAAQTRLTTRTSAAVRTSTARTTTGATSLLGGLVTADAITTQAVVSQSPDGYRTAGSSVLTNLRIAGQPVAAAPGPNTTVTIPDVATVRLNTRFQTNRYGERSVTATAMTVTVLAGNPLALPTGTLLVGSASASIHSPVHRRAYGGSYGVFADVGDWADSGPSGAVYLPCGGSSGKTLTGKAGKVEQLGKVRVGAITSSGRSSDSAASTTASTRTKVTSVDLLGGTVTARAVTASAGAVRTGKKLSLSSKGTTITALRVRGKAVKVRAAPNSVIAIKGVGSLTVRKTTKTASGVQVYALQLKLSRPSGALPAGTLIRVGAAQAGVANA